MKRQALTTYFFEFALGHLSRGNLFDRVPLPVLVFNPKTLEQESIGRESMVIDDPDLVMVYRPEGLTETQFGKGLYLGRAPGANIVVDDPECEMYQAFFKQQHGQWSMTDIEGKNRCFAFDMASNQVQSLPKAPTFTALGDSTYLRICQRWYHFMTPLRFFAEIRRREKQFR